MRCLACGADNREEAKFCDDCGARLKDTPASSETRRTVTVLFADVVGSTALGERLDPELLRQKMTEFFDLAKSVVERHGGVVEKFIGDAAMAVFGLPTVHEDDALRAVRAAAEIRDRLAQSPLAETIAIRVGVNTGQVVAGDPTAGQRLVTGDPVNTAARLQQAAERDEILLGAATHRLVREAVRADETATLRAKGKTEPLRAWRLTRVDERADASTRRVDSPLVGRERELDRLARSFGDAVADDRCALFTLLGAAGVGKSRLVQELVSVVAERATVVRGRCLPYGEGITYWPISEIVRGAAEIEDTDDREVAVRKLNTLLEGETDAERIAALVATAVGLRDGDADRDELFWAIRRFLECVAAGRPLVVVIDDLHWAEPTLLDLVEHIADWSRGAAILLVAIARPELLDVRPAWAGGKIDSTTVLLEPLGDRDARVLAERLLGSLHPEVVDRVMEVAEGNPLFVEQLVAMLTEDGRLAAADATSVEVPPTIQALLAARLDRLPSTERRLAERASVVGRIFERVAVTELSPADEQGDVSSGLRGLVRRELIRPDPASGTPDETFRFLHQLIRDAAYESLSKRDRADLHARFAEWIAETREGRLTELEEIVGYHLEQAHGYRSDLAADPSSLHDLGRRAAAYFLRAGRRAFDRGDPYAAINLYERARKLSPADDPALVAELPFFGIAQSGTGDIEGSLATLGLAQEIGHRLGDESVALRARILEVEALRQAQRMDFAAARSTMEALLPRTLAVQDHFAAARALGALSEMSHEDGSITRSLEEGSRALEHARQAGNSRETTRQLHGVIVALGNGPTPVEVAVRRGEEIVRESSANPIFEALCQASHAEAIARSGEARAARELVARARRTVDLMGIPIPISIVAYSGMVVERVLDAPGAAEQAARQLVDTIVRGGMEFWHGSALALLAETLWLQGRQQEARGLADEAMAIGCHEGPAPRAEFLRSTARILSSDAELDRADAHIAEAKALLADSDALGDKGELALAAAQVAAIAGRLQQSAEESAEALRLFREKGDVSSEKRVERFREKLVPREPGAVV